MCVMCSFHIANTKPIVSLTLPPVGIQAIEAPHMENKNYYYA